MALSLRPPIIRRLYSKSCLAYADSLDTVISDDRRKDIPTTNRHEPSRINMLELNSQLKHLTKSGDLKIARHMFDTLPRRDVISWTTMISGYVSSSDPSEALSLFSKMWVEPDIAMDPFVVSLALKACGLNVNLGYGRGLHGYSVKSGFISSVFVGSSVLDMYMKNGRVPEGCAVFEEMPLRNVVSWTAIITGLVRAGLNSRGLSYFSLMWRDGVEHDSYTYAIALKACADLELLHNGKEIHARILKRGLDTTTYVANSLAAMYNKCGKLDYGLFLFESMSKPDVVSWTSMITSYVQTGQEKLGIYSFLRMRACGIRPNEYTYAAVISGVASIASLEWGQQLHAHAMNVGLAGFPSVANSVMAMYSKCGSLNWALQIFREMAIRDIVSWSTIIVGHSQTGCVEEAFELFSWMRREGPRPTEFALSSMLSVCGSIAILDQGRQLHGYALAIGLDQTALISSSLINMYSKCGCILVAAKVFSLTLDDDIVTWTAMINGYSECGLSREAIELFERMPKAGLRPDRVTFIGVLSACSHAGLLGLGARYFNSMTEEYRIHPCKEHYGCMIDLLCRAGRLEEAERLIRDMPFEKDDVVWSSLLWAIRASGDMERGRAVAEEIIRLDQHCAGAHIMLANIYASGGRWREAADVRWSMRSRGVVKEPGWSWLKVDKDSVSTFRAGERDHPRCEEIYGVLESVYSREELSIEELDSIACVFGE